MFNFFSKAKKMTDLEFAWEDGTVGDFWLTIGLNEKSAHVYKTPWTGQNWWADAEFFGLDKGTYPTLLEAQEAVEYAVERWFGKAVYTSPKTLFDDDFGTD